MSKEEYKQKKDNKDSQIRREILEPNARNINALKSIEGVDPKYAKHMFLSNQLMESFIMHKGGGLELLGQPVCPHCEKPCAWDISGTAYCFSCNKSIPKEKVFTVAQYLIQETKGVDVETLKLYVKEAEKDEIIK